MKVCYLYSEDRGRGGMVDTLVLEANAASVRVRVSSSAPIF